jgi:ferredoxin
VFYSRQYASQAVGDRGQSSTTNLRNRRITFIYPDGTPHQVIGNDGEHLLTLAQNNSIDLEGACGGQCACSTCHVMIDESKRGFEQLEAPTESELDMLDLASGLQETSRLGCQICLKEGLDGLIVSHSALHTPSRA